MGEKKLTKRDRINMFLRTNLQQASFNYERMHGLGMAFDMVPAIKRLYDTKEEQVAALKRHLTFFNVTPAAVGPVLGVTAALEESKANGADIDEGTIGSIKIGLMGPFCGVGDPIFWGTLRPITAAIGASLALNGSLLGPVLFFAAFKPGTSGSLVFWSGIWIQKGIRLCTASGRKYASKVTEGASILGLFVMGALVSAWTTINVPLVISKVTANGENNNYYCTGYSGPSCFRDCLRWY